MTHTPTHRFTTLLGYLALVLAPSASHAQHHTYRVLDPFPDGQSVPHTERIVSPTGINDAGVVVGSYGGNDDTKGRCKQDPADHAFKCPAVGTFGFVFDGRRSVLLYGPFPVNSRTIANGDVEQQVSVGLFGVNNSGQVLGTSRTTDQGIGASFVYDIRDSTYRLVGRNLVVTPRSQQPGADVADILPGISDKGEILIVLHGMGGTGAFSNGNAPVSGFAYGVPTLGAPGSLDAPTAPAAFTAMPPCPGGAAMTATGIGLKGDVVGYCQGMPNAPRTRDSMRKANRAFTFQNGQFTFVDQPDQLPQGPAVFYPGLVGNGNVVRVPDGYLYDGTTLVQLDAPDGYKFTGAHGLVAMNDRGDFVGSLESGGNAVAVVASPATRTVLSTVRMNFVPGPAQAAPASSAAVPARGAASISDARGSFTLSFVDESGASKTFPIARPDIVGFTQQIWNDLNTNHAGQGMWLVSDGGPGKVRIVDVQVKAAPNGKIVVDRVVVGPAVTMADVARVVSDHGMTLKSQAVPP